MKRVMTCLFCVLVLVLTSACGKNQIDGQQESKGSMCTVSVSCSEVLEKMDMLEEAKRELVPENGIILTPKQVTFREGETALDVLSRELKENKIHFEYETLQGTDITYVSAIGNLYEFDCGGSSGWTYTVNGEAPDCSADAYVVQNGDVITWNYITEFEME